MSEVDRRPIAFQFDIPLGVGVSLEPGAPVRVMVGSTPLWCEVVRLSHGAEETQVSLSVITPSPWEVTMMELRQRELTLPPDYAVTYLQEWGIGPGKLP